jgi:hypothetical protein
MKTRFGLPTLLLACALFCGCGDGDKLHPSAPLSASTPAATGNAAAYGITAFVQVSGHPEQSGWKHVQPVDWSTWGKSLPKEEAPATSDPDPGASVPPKAKTARYASRS